MDNIILRPSGYYFRLAVPPDLKDLFGIREIKRTLKTGSLSLAKERASLLSGRIKILFRKLRMKPLKREDLQGLIHQYMLEALEAEEDERLMAGTVSNKLHTEMIEGIEGAVVEAQRDLRHNDFTIIETLVDSQILKPKGIKADKNSFEYKKLCRETIKAMTKFFEIQKKRENGDYPDEVENPLTVSPEAPVAIEIDKPKGPSIRTLKDKWFLENKKADAWKPRSLEAYTGYFSIFYQILEDDTPIDSIG